MMDSELNQLFSTCGTVVACKVSMDPATGQSKGSGFVRFSKPEEAMAAIQTMNGENGMQVKLAYSDAGQGALAQAAKVQETPTDNLYIRGLPSPQIDEVQLNTMFEEIGCKIVRHRIIADTRGAGTSAAMVQLTSKEKATEALGILNGSPSPSGGRLQVTYVQQKERSTPQTAVPAIRRPPAHVPVPVAPPNPGMMGLAGALPPNLTLSLRFAGPEQMPCDNLYIAGLPSPQVEEKALQAIFDNLGLKVQRLRLLPDTRMKGFSAALVQVGSQEEATLAIGALNGKKPVELELKSVPLGTENKDPVHGNMFIGNLARNIDEDQLKQLFEGFGEIVSVRISRDPEGNSKGSGFVKVKTAEEAKLCIDSMNGQNGILVKTADYDLPEKGKGASKSSWNPGKGVWAGPAAWQQPWMVGPIKRKWEEPPEKEIMVNYDNDEDQPSETVWVVGLPSPKVEQIALLEFFISLDLKVNRVEVIPDSGEDGMSGAKVEFFDQEMAARGMEALQGQLPSKLGFVAVGARAPKAKPAPKFVPPPVRPKLISIRPPPQPPKPRLLHVKFKGDPATPSDHIFIGNMPAKVDAATLKTALANLGLTVLWEKVMTNQWGDPNGTCAAIVQLTSQDEAEYAIQSLNGEEFPFWAAELPSEAAETTAKSRPQSPPPDMSSAPDSTLALTDTGSPPDLNASPGLSQDESMGETGNSEQSWDGTSQPWTNNEQSWDSNEQPWDSNEQGQPWDNNQQSWDEPYSEAKIVPAKGSISSAISP